MIRVSVADVADQPAQAVLRPVCADGSAVTPAMRRLELLAGPELGEQCRRLGELPAGSAVITRAGELPAEYMVHAVVRTADEASTAAVVRSALVNALRRVVEWEIETIAIPPLGTGAGNLEVEEAAQVMIPVLLDHLRNSRFPLQVEIVVDSGYEKDVFEQGLRWLGDPAGGPTPVP